MSVLWVADASLSLDCEWCEANAYDVRRGQGTATNDPAWAKSSRVRPTELGVSCWQVTVVDGDVDAFTSGAQRTELGQGNPSRKMADGVDRLQYQGQHRFIAFNLLIPKDFAAADWCAVQQNKGQGDGNGPLTWYFWKGRLIVEKSASQSYGSTNMNVVWQSTGTVPRDRWLRLMFEVNWSAGSDGFYAIYGDLADGHGFRTLKGRTNGWTLKHGADGKPVAVGSRVGIYRAKTPGTHSLFFGGFTVGDDRGSVTERAFGASL